MFSGAGWLGKMVVMLERDTFLSIALMCEADLYE